MATHSFLPGEFHGQRSLAGYTVHGVAKSQTQLKQLTLSLSHFPCPQLRSWMYAVYGALAVVGTMGPWYLLLLLGHCVGLYVVSLFVVQLSPNADWAM